MVLEHLVDTVLYLEGDRSHAFRLLRTVKNRFGPTHELGIFEMQEAGLVEVTNPSGLFMAERSLEVPGAAVIPSLEGSRPILVEVQALVSPSSLAQPRRQSMGVDPGRVSLLVAILEKRVGLAMGGTRLLRQRGRRGAPHRTRRRPGGGDGPGLIVPRPAGTTDTLIFGEVGLTGEVRAVSAPELRLKEGLKLGFNAPSWPNANRNTWATSPAWNSWASKPWPFEHSVNSSGQKWLGVRGQGNAAGF